MTLNQCAPECWALKQDDQGRFYVANDGGFFGGRTVAYIAGGPREELVGEFIATHDPECVALLHRCARQLEDEAEMCQVSNGFNACKGQCRWYPCDKCAAVEAWSQYRKERAER